MIEEQIVAGRLGRVRALTSGPPGAPVVLLLHGNPDTADLWRPTMSRLPAWRCVALDLPGFGDSEPHGQSIGLGPFADWVASALDALEIRGTVRVVAHDFGGPYGIAWAVMHPERVAAVAVTNTVFFPNLRWHRWARVWRTPLVGELATAWTPRWVFAAELRRGGPGLSEQAIAEAWSRVTPTTHRAVLRLYRATSPAVFGERVPGRDESWHQAWLALARAVPSLTLWGERDPYLRTSWIEDLGTTGVARFPQSGHWLPAEDPEGFAARLDAFLGSAAREGLR